MCAAARFWKGIWFLNSRVHGFESNSFLHERQRQRQKNLAIHAVVVTMCYYMTNHQSTNNSYFEFIIARSSPSLAVFTLSKEQWNGSGWLWQSQLQVLEYILGHLHYQAGAELRLDLNPVPVWIFGMIDAQDGEYGRSCSPQTVLYKPTACQGHLSFSTPQDELWISLPGQIRLQGSVKIWKW
jgi:hypothetical protein